MVLGAHVVGVELRVGHVHEQDSHYGQHGGYQHAEHMHPRCTCTPAPHTRCRKGCQGPALLSLAPQLNYCMFSDTQLLHLQGLVCI